MPLGYGFGFGRSRGFGRGWGAGWQNYPGWGCRRYPGRPRGWRGMMPPYDPITEAEDLRQQASFLKQRLEAIEKRLKDLETETSAGNDRPAV